MKDVPQIVILMDNLSKSSMAHLYEQIISQSLVDCLPPVLWQSSTSIDEDLDDQRQEFLSTLPRIWTSSFEETAPHNVSFFVLSKFRQNSFKFFYEMICQWLIPGKSLNAVMVHAGDFKLRSIDQVLLSLCEVTIHFDSAADLEQGRQNFATMESELRLGMRSSFYAKQILEVRGVTLEGKMGLVREEIVKVISHWNNDFGNDLLSEMQHLFVICNDQFKEVRERRHLTRIIINNYTFRKKLREALKQEPHKRHLSVRVFKGNLHLAEGVKPVLSVMVGLNFLHANEIFEERHLLSAIQNYIPTARAIEGSFFANTHGNETICTFYLDIEKSHSGEFTLEEIKFLSHELSLDLKDRIEHLLNPIFMTRNEEEVMRNLLTLSSQLKYLHDLPQVMIVFDEQTPLKLIFTVIVVQVMKDSKNPISEKLKDLDEHYEYLHDRTRIMGYLRKKHPKEATVFRLKLPKEPFLRNNHAIDLNKARQAIVNELTRLIGDIRDFNGGMISKQYTLLCEIRESLKQVKYNELLLENFFYGLTPDGMRTVLPATVLSKMFLLLIESIDKDLFNGGLPSLKIVPEQSGVYLLIKAEGRSFKETMMKVLNKSQILISKVGSSCVQVYEGFYLVVYYQTEDLQKQQEFIDLIKGLV